MEHDKQTHQPRKTGKTVNSLSGGERFKLWSALVEARAELEALRADYRQAAGMMTQRLGFTVTHNNIRDAVHQGIVSWKTPGRGSGGGSPLAQKVKALEERLAAVEDVVLRLCSATGTSQKVEPMRAPDAWVSE